MQHNVTRLTLKNGAEGLFIDVPSSSVTTIDIVFRAGDYLSPKGKTDTAHVMEHLVLGANKKYPTSREFSKEFSKYGAYNNAYTGDYHMGYEAECEASETERIVDLLCIAIESPLFTRDDFLSEIGNVREELKMRRNNDDLELSLLLENAMGFLPKSYRLREKELSAITLLDVENHYFKTHTTSNMRFVIAGPISTHVAVVNDRLERLALPWGDGYIPLPNEVPKHLTKPLLVKNSNLDNLCYRWEVVLPKPTTDIERYSLDALHEILFNGFHSKLFGTLREKGLVYGIYGNYYETQNNAINVINGQVQASNITEVFKIMRRELEKIAKDGVTKKELVELRKRAYGEMQRYHQTPNQLSNWYRGPFITRDEVTNLQDFPSRLEKVTATTIKEMTNAILGSKIYGLGLMHNGSDTPHEQELHQIIRQ